MTLHLLGVAGARFEVHGRFCSALLFSGDTDSPGRCGILLFKGYRRPTWTAANTLLSHELDSVSRLWIAASSMCSRSRGSASSSHSTI